ncbi:MAG: type II secretion system protein E [Gammaproteobacteria bacterium HGW-Gammaproteobacteria-1]|jgi:type IV pilus assembly protein PilB|nr:MAG: type II secretion system protein E [Gammaproteobacteria bacterium HGW-Gammaproteobacteria-1]
MKNSPLGELLLSTGHVTAEQLEVALHTQKARPGYLGEILVGLDFVTADEIAHAVATQHKLPYVDLCIAVPQKKALEALPKDIALDNGVLPLRIKRGVLTVVTHDPAAAELASMLRDLCGLEISFAISDKALIAQSIELYYFELENPIENRIATLVDEAANERDIDIEAFLDLLIQNAVKDRATDIHIRPQALSSHVFYRVDGVLHHYFSFPSRIHRNVISRVKVLSEMDITRQRIPQDGGFAFNYLRTAYDIRVAIVPTSFGENMVLRILPKTEALHRLERLGFEAAQVAVLERCLRKQSGIILTVGPSGSGKTTTLYSTLRRTNILQRNVVTVEDPIEYQLSLVQQTNVNESAGYTFAESLQHLVRQDADIILIGEVRNQETALAVARSALSGHLILSTMTANDAQGAVARLMDFGIKSYMLSATLLAVLYQRLVRRLCDNCKRPVSLPRAQLSEYGLGAAEGAAETVTVYEAVGCEHCRRSGYRGRVAVAELLEIGEDIRELLDKGRIALETGELLRRQGAATIREDAGAKLLQGITSLEEIRRVFA